MRLVPQKNEIDPTPISKKPLTKIWGGGLLHFLVWHPLFYQNWGNFCLTFAPFVFLLFPKIRDKIAQF